MNRRRLALLAAASAALSGCDSCESPIEDPAPVEISEGSSERIPDLTIEQLVRRHAGEPLSSVALGADGKVALFGQSGAFVVTQLERASDDPPTQQAVSAVMDSAWIQSSIVGLETSPAALVLWSDSAAEQARIVLAGEAVDLWADETRGVVWTLTRVGSAAEVRAHAVADGELQPRLTHAIGGQPVGLYGSAERVYAPTFADRTITQFSADDLAWVASTPVEERPLFVHPMHAGFAVVGANSDSLQLVGSSGTTTHEMPQPQWIREVDGAAYAFTSGDSTLRRLDPETLEERASTTELGLAMDVAPLAAGLAVIDAGAEASIALLDPDTLELRAGRVAEGRPATITATGPDTLLVVSPAEGMVTTYRVLFQ